jgi:small nuclear ribonucleoprotein E
VQLSYIWYTGSCFLLFQGFDEFMNVVLDDAEEVDMKTGARKRLGRTLLKGDNITLIMKASAAVSTASAVAEAAPAAASSSSSSSAAASH